MIGNTYDTDKVYFVPGDVVTIKHDIANKPEMLVQTVDKSTIHSDKGILLGVTCIWFSKDMVLQKNRFSTKDIKKV